MTLQFEKFKKKLARKKYLELDFDLEDIKSLAIIDDKENIELLKKALNKKLRYEGSILLAGTDIKKDKTYYAYLQEDIGFYNSFSIYQNIKNLLKIYKIKFNKENLLEIITSAGFDPKIKYEALSEVEKEKLKLVFTALLPNELLIIDMTNNLFEDSDNEYLINFIKDNIENRGKIIVVLASKLNDVTNVCKKALIISDNKQIYFDDIKKLNVVKELVIVELETFTEEQLYSELHFDFKIIGKKLIMRKENLEDALYYFVKVNINVLSIKDFNENTELYEVKK